MVSQDSKPIENPQEKQEHVGKIEPPTDESPQKALEEAQAKAESNLAGWQRAQADFMNFKRRSEQEKAEAIKFANTNLILSLLPILDDFDRAIEVIPKEASKEKWVEGIQLIQRKIRKTLDNLGVSAIPAVGEAFDPNCHEAVVCCKGKKDTVVQELEKGYRLHERVIRPSKVMVGTGEDEKIKEKKQEKPADKPKEE